MLHQMTQFGKYQMPAGQFAGFKTSRNTKHNCFADNTSRCPRQNGRRIYLFEAELGKQRAERRQFLVKDRTYCFNGNILAADARTARQDQHLGIVLPDGIDDRAFNDNGIVRYYRMKQHIVFFLLCPAADPVPAFIIRKCPGGGN